MCRTAAAARGRRRDCTCKLCQVAHPFPHPERSLLSMRPSDSNGGTWESSPGQEHTRSTHRQHRQHRSRRCAQEEEGREAEEKEEEDWGRGGGASTASQEAGGRVAMQMGSIHIANHWSLSALQRKSLFRQNSRNWSYVPQPWFLSQPLSTLHCSVSFNPLSCVDIHMRGKGKKESKARMRDGLDSFLILLLSCHLSWFLHFFHPLSLFPPFSFPLCESWGDVW